MSTSVHDNFNAVIYYYLQLRTFNKCVKIFRRKLCILIHLPFHRKKKMNMLILESVIENPPK